MNIDLPGVIKKLYEDVRNGDIRIGIQKVDEDMNENEVNTNINRAEEWTH